VADLDRAIPEVMSRYGIPGLSIALIREHQIVWERSYGVANTITRKPLTTETALPVASIGKPIAAMTALSFVDDGTITLEGPLGEGISSEWLPDSALRAQVNLRHILTHTSGLSNFLGDRRKAAKFPAGQQYSYSGVGFMYLQHVLETRANAPLDSLAFQSVFRPLGMTHTWFGQGDDAVAGNGHISFLRAVAPFGIIFLPVAIMAWVAGAVVVRFVLKMKRVPLWLTCSVFFAALVFAWWFLIVRASDPNIVPFFAGSSLLLLAFVVIATAGVGKVFQKFVSSQAAIRWIRPVVGLIILAATIMILRDQPVPVPDVTGPNGNAASSLRSTVGDIARIAIAISKAGEQAGASMRQMTVPHVRASEHVWWGLGVGIQESEAGPALFHWGRNPSMRAAFVMYPKSGHGAVVVVNLGDVGEAVTEVLSRAIGGPTYWANE
jgi:CubicO group peptidase (beta-lactamase class C family)